MAGRQTSQKAIGYKPRLHITGLLREAVDWKLMASPA